jgi:transcriptional regulator with XRE-family HTH domain
VAEITFQEAAEERLIHEAIDVVTDLMDAEGVSRAEMARRLRTSRSHVTQILNGHNVTLKTLAKMAYQLGAELRLEVRDG